MVGDLSSVLFLGERSPYGLSVARWVLRSGLGVRRVIVLSGAPKRPGAGLGGLLPRMARAARRALAPPQAPPPGGEPIDPIRLEAGTTPAQLRDECARAGIAWQEVEEIRSRAFLEELSRPAPDLLLSAACPFIFSDDLLALPRRASINFHPSLLPRCRGSHPIYWTLAQDEPRGGVTAHLMTRDVDAGDIIMQVALPLTARDDYSRLYHRCMEVSSALVDGVERWVASGARGGKAQDPASATRFREDTEEDHRIDWSRCDARRVAALARAGHAFTTWRGERLGILRVRDVEMAPEVSPGRIETVGNGALRVGCAGSIAAIEELSFRGLRYAPGTLCGAIGLAPGAELDSGVAAEAAR